LGGVLPQNKKRGGIKTSFHPRNRIEVRENLGPGRVDTVGETNEPLYSPKNTEKRG